MDRCRRRRTDSRSVDLKDRLRLAQQDRARSNVLDPGAVISPESRIQYPSGVEPAFVGGGCKNKGRICCYVGHEAPSCLEPLYSVGGLCSLTSGGFRATLLLRRALVLREPGFLSGRVN